MTVNTMMPTPPPPRPETVGTPRSWHNFVMSSRGSPRPSGPVCPRAMAHNAHYASSEQHGA